MIGRTVSRYRILEQLGAGGMGVVYKAEDTKLGRLVALKFLPEELGRHPHALERFEREARATSSLNHPHICTIYDIDQVDGQSFIAMELLEGEPLRARLKGRPLGIAEIVDITAQVADALGAAHAQGIVHRDIKPENIFLTARGAAKLLDFGVAKLMVEQAVATASSRTTVFRTEPGSALGTVAYMAPEQIRGESLDGRADLFSLGVVIYEMATGTPPFQGSTWGTTVAAILTQAPTPPVELNPDLSGDMVQIIGRALEKTRDLRYPSASSLLADLGRVRSAAVGAGIGPSRQPSIAVLPLENLRGSPDDAFVADGLTEELTAALAGVGTLRVIAPASARIFKDSNKSPSAATRDLNARHVLTGGVEREESRVRIALRLIDARTGLEELAEEFAGSLDDVCDLRERVVRRVVKAVGVTLTAEEGHRLAARPTSMPRTYETWLRIRYAASAPTGEGLERGLVLAHQALANLGDDALLYAALGVMHHANYESGTRANETSLRLAETYAARALERDPDLPLGLRAMGLVRHAQGDLQAFVGCMRRAVELERTSDGLVRLAFALAMVGRMTDARRDADVALASDPLVFRAAWVAAVVEFFDGRFEAALVRMRAAVEGLAPSEPFGLWWLAQAYAYHGREDEARALFERVTNMEASPWTDVSEVWRLALEGDRGGVLEWFAVPSAAQHMVVVDQWYPCVLAACLARVGELSEALDWVERAVSWGFSNHLFLSRHDRFLAPLGTHPRFDVLMDRAREKEQAFRV
jgi:TolB-like protein/tetratricopeptide (TPR) repeat protein